MAIRLSEFRKSTYKAGGKVIEVPNLYETIKIDKLKGRKYLARFKHEEKIYAKVLGYSKKNGVIDISPKEAGKLLEAYRKDIEDGYTPSNVSTLNKLAESYFETFKETDWNKTKKNIYNRYIGTYKEDSKKDDKLKKKSQRVPTKEELKRQKSFDKNKIGNKPIEGIREMHITRIITNMDNQGLKPRTQKTVIEVIKPMFNFAVKNKIAKDNPAKDINVEVPSQKKLVTNATELFKRLYAGIIEYYHDNPYYKALFLFGFTGRRKGEILNLKWENIDFTHNYYWIEDTKTNDQQKYELPYYLIEALQEIKDDRKGLVFKSPVTGKVLTGLHRQMEHLKKYTGIENLTMHYMRNIIVSALAEQGTEAITLSGILGHKDPNTINKYLSINHYISSQIGLRKVDDILDVEVIDD